LPAACASPRRCAGFGRLREVPRRDAVLASLTKWSGRALRPSDVPSLVSRACQQVRSGRPRPVALELPPDVLQTVENVCLLEPARIEPAPGAPGRPRQAAARVRRAGH